MEEIKSQNEWDAVVDRFGGHPLQYWGWGELKQRGGWEVRRVANSVGGAQILVKKLPIGKMFFVPRGPFGGEGFLRDLATVAKEAQANILKIEPEWKKTAECEEVLRKTGFQKSKNHVFIAKTAEIELAEEMNGYLAKLDKKTRQYVNKSMRELEIVQIGHDETEKIRRVFEIYVETAARAGFRIHSYEYYAGAAELMGGHNRIYGAFHEGEMVAFLWNIASKTIEFECYGGVNEIGQKMKANYGLKWMAILAAARNGEKVYDMNGLLNDGISDFKRHFITESGEVELVETWDYYPSMVGRALDTGMAWARKVKRAIS